MIRIRRADDDDGCSGEAIQHPRPVAPADAQLRAVRVRIEEARSLLMGARELCREGAARPVLLEIIHGSLDLQIDELRGLEREAAQAVRTIERDRDARENPRR